MNSIESAHEHCIEVCNGLLRGELSAIETYEQAIEKHSDSPAAMELRRICSEHSRAANRITANVRQMGGEPEEGSGAWGVFANAVQGTEEAGRQDYQDALLDDDVMPECKQMIRDELLPPVIEHIASLDRLEQTA